MVDTLESLLRTQSGTLPQAGSPQASAAAAATRDAQAANDPVTLSEQALNAVAQSQAAQQTQAASDTESSRDAKVSLNVAMSRTVNDLSWLFNIMSPPHVDSSVVVRAVGERATADNVGVSPPMALIRAWAEQAGKTAALYVENLSVTAGPGGTTATVDRVALTTIDPTLAKSTTTNDGRPVVLDVGGDATKVAPYVQPALVANNDIATGEQHALLVIRQGGQAMPEGTLRVRLDALLPLD